MLKELINDGYSLMEYPEEDINGFPAWVNAGKREDFLKWARKALLFLQEEYKGHPMIPEFKKLIDEDKKTGELDTIISLIGILEAFEEIRPKTININYDSIVCRIIERFNDCARQLRRRHGNRPTLVIEDEYDVQDLLHAVLKLNFLDVRPEEWTPSYAGNSNRMDFLLKEANIAIEVKMARDNLKDKEIGEQLLVDIAKYRVHPDVNTLYCFVYDPAGFVRNPVGLENDLNKESTDALAVKVFVR